MTMFLLCLFVNCVLIQIPSETDPVIGGVRLSIGCPLIDKIKISERFQCVSVSRGHPTDVLIANSEEDNVLCQTVLTQTNSVTAQPGETARMSCDIGQGKDSKVLGFYKQAVGGVPQLVLYHYHSWGSPRYGPNFSSDRFSANKNSAGTVYELIISRTQPSDGAVYYCGKWVNAESRFVTQ